MQGLLIVVLVGCVAAVAGLTFKPGGIDKQLYTQARRNPKTGGRGIQQDEDGIDPRFNGPRPTGGVLHYNFKQNFDSINPRNANADWRWALPEEIDADNGAFLRDAPNTVDMVAIPFESFEPQDSGRVAPLGNQYEALIVNKQNISVMPGQVLSVNVRFACRTFNAEDTSFSQAAASKPEDDPSLVSCGFGIASYDESAIIVSIVATNNGVWSVYERNRFEMLAHPERNHREFNVFQRLADRSSPYDTIDATIRLDRSQNKAELIVDGEVKQTITELGSLNSILDSREGAVYNDVYTRNRPDLTPTDVQDVQVSIGLVNYPDSTDPNHPGSPSVRGSKLTTDPTYYDPKAKFEDNEGKEENIHWGEGASMTLVDARIELEGTPTAGNRVGGGRRSRN